MIAGGFMAYALGAFQSSNDNLTIVPFAAAYINYGQASPWESLRIRERACLNELVLRGAALGSDGDALDRRDTCQGERVLEIERAGGVLNLPQLGIAPAARAYAQQQRYFLLAQFFLLIGLIPWVYKWGKAIWLRIRKPMQTIYRYIRQVLRKMS
jgi:hypothetical protein